MNIDGVVCTPDLFSVCVIRIYVLAHRPLPSFSITLLYDEALNAASTLAKLPSIAWVRQGSSAVIFIALQ